MTTEVETTTLVGMKRTVAHFTSFIHGKARIGGHIDESGSWVIDLAKDRDGVEFTVPDFERADAIEELSLQATQDVIDAERESAWLRDCGEDLYAMTDEDLDSFELDAQGYLAAASAR